MASTSAALALRFLLTAATNRSISLGNIPTRQFNGELSVKAKPVLSMLLCFAFVVATACSEETQQKPGAVETLEKSETAKTQKEVSQPGEKPSVQKQETSVQKQEPSVREQKTLAEGKDEESTLRPATVSTPEPKPVAEGEKVSSEKVSSKNTTRPSREPEPADKGEEAPAKTAARSTQAGKSAFRVVSTNPANGASGVSPNLMRIKVTFSHDVNVDSLYDTRINGNRIGGTSGQGSTISITSRRPVGTGKSCTVTIPPDAASVDGKRLGKAYSFTFTTASDVAD